MDLTTTLEKNPDVVARNLSAGEGGVLLHLVTGAYHGMNEVGHLIWGEIDGKRSVGELIRAISERIEDPPARLENDVLTFLDSALDRDLVRPVSPSAED